MIPGQERLCAPRVAAEPSVQARTFAGGGPPTINPRAVCDGRRFGAGGRRSLRGR